LARIDALVALTPEAAEAAAERFPGDYRLVSPGVDPDLFRPGPKRELAVLEWRPAERQLARATIRVLRELPGWELLLPRTKRLSEDADFRARTAAAAREAAATQSFAAVAADHDELYTRLARRRRPRRNADPLGDRDWILCDLHMHTSWSHDCRVEVVELVDHAEAEGLGAIAVTDHNSF